MRSYLLAGNAGHYDGVIAALEARGLRVIPAFASGLDARPAIERFFMQGRPRRGRRGGVADRLLAGRRPGLQRRHAPPRKCWRALDVPYLAAHPVEFQTLEQWGASERGLLPVESDHDGRDPRTRRRDRPDGLRRPRRRRRRACTGCDRGCTFGASDEPRHARLRRARRRARRARRRGWSRCAAAERARAQGRDRAVQLPAECRQHRHRRLSSSVFESLHQHAAARMRARATRSTCRPASTSCASASSHGNAAALRRRRQRRTRASPADDHVRRERWLRGDRGAVGPGARAGSRATAARSSCSASASATSSSACSRPSATKATRCGCCSRRASRRRTPSPPSTAGCARISAPHAVLHFGTHGALEFMPGKQAGLSGACWPDRLIGDLPNLYLYASNNPSEGTHRQAPRRRDADQLPDAAGRAAPGSIAACSTSRPRSSAGARSSREADARARRRSPR